MSFYFRVHCSSELLSVANGHGGSWGAIARGWIWLDDAHKRAVKGWKELALSRILPSSRRVLNVGRLFCFNSNPLPVVDGSEREEKEREKEHLHPAPPLRRCAGFNTLAHKHTQKTGRACRGTVSQNATPSRHPQAAVGSVDKPRGGKECAGQTPAAQNSSPSPKIPSTWLTIISDVSAFG